MLGQGTSQSYPKGIAAVAALLQSGLVDRVLDDPWKRCVDQVLPYDVSGLGESAKYLALANTASVQPPFDENGGWRT